MLQTKKYEKIQELISSGMTASASCQKVGIPRKSWYNHKAALKRKADRQKRAARAQAKVQVQNLPQPPSRAQQMFVLFGSPDEIRTFIRGYHE